MHWTSALSRHTALEAAIREVTDTALAALGEAPDVVFLFASEHHQEGFDTLPGAVRGTLGARTLVGCSASGVIGGGSEVESQPALGLVAGRLPGTRMEAWHVEGRDLGPGTEHSDRCVTLARETAPDPVDFLVLADPFSFPAEQLIHSLEAGFPRAVIAGGLASGGRAPGEMALFIDDRTHRTGAVMLALTGNVEMATAVAQGCRPIGEPMFLTGHEGNTILGLDGRSPLEVLNDVYEKAGERDRELMRHSLFIGITMRGDGTEYHQGDFLIRNLVGADQETGALQVGADLHPNQVVQFHLRDARTSAEDLERVLERARDQYGATGPEGALLFSCTGRGEGLYAEPDHDSEAFRRHLGAVPLGGFFCNGEIGPVQGRTYLHGYTSAFALFRPRDKGG